MQRMWQEAVEMRPRARGLRAQLALWLVALPPCATAWA